MFDLVLRNGRVFTGAGNPWFKADVGVKKGKIAKVGLIKGPAKETIDVRGQAVCPGRARIDRADFAPAEATMRYPVGIAHLVVNGVVTLRDGAHTGARAGLVLRK